MDVNRVGRMITAIGNAAGVESGDPAASEQLLPLVNDERGSSVAFPAKEHTHTVNQAARKEQGSQGPSMAIAYTNEASHGR